MAKYFATINGSTKLPLFYYDGSSLQSSQQLHFKSTDLAALKSALSSIETIVITDDEENQIATFAQFDGYVSMNYVGAHYSEQLGEEADEIIVTLTKADFLGMVDRLEGQVDRLDKQVNPVVDTESMTLNEYKEYKVSNLSKAGQEAIFAGTSITLMNGTTKNFTYNFEDQSNLLNAMFIIKELDDLDITIPYHGHGEPCELYAARDILLIYFGLQFFSVNLQTRINMLNSWVRSCQTKEEVAAINFNSTLPAEYLAMANEIMGPSMALAEELRSKYFAE